MTRPLCLLVVAVAALASFGAATQRSSTGDFRALKGGAFVIGDVHADLGCARAWVNRSGLVDLEVTPWAWKGGHDQALVFLGDYVDKGWQGRQVMEFVRGLTEHFPKNVVALLGNHDLYLLLDALHEDGATAVMGRAVRQYAFSFTNLEEYLNWLPGHWRGVSNESVAVLDALHEALDYVYTRRGERSVLLGEPPEEFQNRFKNLFTVAPPFREDPELATLVQDKLVEWQDRMYQGLVETGLAAWLAERPLVARVGGALLTHGGLPLELLEKLQEKRPKDDVYKALEEATTLTLRRVWEERLTLMAPGSVQGDLEGISRTSPIHQLVTYRGLHKSCEEVEQVIEMLNASGDGPDLIVVGHTPEDFARLSCDDRLAAMDSSLSRYFRVHGNLYCPARTKTSADRSASASGRRTDCGNDVAVECEGNAGSLSFVGGRWRLTIVDMRPEIDVEEEDGNSAAWRGIAAALIPWIAMKFCTRRMNADGTPVDPASDVALADAGGAKAQKAD